MEHFFIHLFYYGKTALSCFLIKRWQVVSGLFHHLYYAIKTN